jgi:endonuclease/exonuclease/phosphatase family metal-dependent hydrolase
MTRNLFLGADLTPAYQALAAPTGPADLPAAVAGIFNPGEPPGVVQRTDFATRAVGLADEIEAARPDLIGLQEAALWRTGDTVAADHLELLEAELARRGLRYRRVSVKVNGDVAMPSAAGIMVGLSDREAILARDGGGLVLSNVQSGAFETALPIETPSGTFALARGWLAVDARLGETSLRFISTHLEVAGRREEAAAVQRAQAGELIAGPARTELPVVLLGDFNARPDSATYRALIAAGFDDAWTRTHPDGPAGLTCCHAHPLDDPADTLTARIDLILTRGPIAATEAFVVGDAPADFRSGLWPSDHAGVVATLGPV